MTESEGITPQEDVPEIGVAEEIIPDEQDTGADSSWQERLDIAFPYGASVTIVDDVPEGVGFDDSPQFLTPRFLVLSETDGNPLVSAQVYGIEKEIEFTILSQETLSPGVLLFHTPAGEQDVLASSNLDPAVANELRNLRQEWYGS